MKASIIIRAYNEERYIGKLLKSIQKQKFIKERPEVIVVDSGSFDKTVPIAKQYGAKIVHISPSEFTFGHSLNMGIESASGDYLVFISAHCCPIKDDWLVQLLRPFEQENIAGVYGKQRGTAQSAFSEQQLFHQWYPETLSTDQNHAFCNNANMAIRKDVWMQHPYDTQLTGLEDIDWAKRVTGNKKWKIGYAADAGVFHEHKETRKSVYNRYKREGIAYSRIYPDEKFSFSDFLKFFVANTFSDYKYAREEKKLMKNAMSIPTFRFMQFFGTFRGRDYKKKVNHELIQRLYYPRWRR